MTETLDVPQAFLAGLRPQARSFRMPVERGLARDGTSRASRVVEEEVRATCICS